MKKEKVGGPSWRMMTKRALVEADNDNISYFQIALCTDLFCRQDGVNEEEPQLPLSDGDLGGGEEETNDGDVGAEREDDGGRTAKVNKV